MAGEADERRGSTWATRAAFAVGALAILAIGIAIGSSRARWAAGPNGGAWSVAGPAGPRPPAWVPDHPGRATRQFPGQAPGQFQGQQPGQFQGQAPGRFQGQAPGQSQGQGPGQSQGYGPGQSQGQAPGQNRGAVLPPGTSGFSAAQRGRIASVIGMQPAELDQELRAGKALGTIAQDRGVTRDALRTAVVDALIDAR